jgi:hypothetical protein
VPYERLISTRAPLGRNCDKASSVSIVAPYWREILISTFSGMAEADALTTNLLQAKITAGSGTIAPVHAQRAIVHV